MAFNPSTRTILLVALGAGVLGIVAGLAGNGSGPLTKPLLRTESGQRLLQGVLATTAPPPPVGLSIAARGDPMPRLQLVDRTGEQVVLPDRYPGSKILINFWASWCGPCIREMPELDRFAATQGSAGVQVVGVALDSLEAVTGFLHSTPVTYPILLDVPGPRDSSVQLGNPKGVLPYTVLIGPDGRLLKQKIGPFEDGEVDGWVSD